MEKTMFITPPYTHTHIPRGNYIVNVYTCDIGGMKSALIMLDNRV